MRQFPFHQFVLDFYCHEKRLGIELDGSLHAELESMAHDAERTAFLGAHGIRMLRFWNREVLEDFEGVLEAIVKASGPSPALPAALSLRPFRDMGRNVATLTSSTNNLHPGEETAPQSPCIVIGGTNH